MQTYQLNVGYVKIAWFFKSFLAHFKLKLDIKDLLVH